MSHGQLGIAVPYLREWRLYAALKQSELAERAGVGRSTITRGEGGSSISIVNARALAQALSVTVQQLRYEAARSTADVGENSDA